MNTAPAGIRRLLALRLDNLGDLLMTSPALAALEHGLPQAHVTLLASPAGAAAAPHLEGVDEVWTTRVPWMPGGENELESSLVDRLRDGRFDAAVIFTVCTQSALPAALLCRMAGIPLRLAHSRENPYGLLTHWQPEVDDIPRGRVRHEVERQLALVAAWGCQVADERLRFAVHHRDRQGVAAMLQRLGVGDFAVLHPGASAPSRRWPPERFGAVATALTARGIVPIFCGSSDEQALVRSAMPPHGAISLAGRLGLGELAALIEGARVLVANNSAPAHLAAAVGTPVVCLYALTNPQHTPWRVECRVLSHEVPCRDCLKSTCPQGHHACLRGVSVDAAVDAVLDVMRQSVLPHLPESRPHGPIPLLASPASPRSDVPAPAAGPVELT